MNLDEIGACLKADGWPVDEVSSAALQTRFRGKARVFPLLIHVTDDLVTFAVLPLGRAPADADDAEELLSRLLRYNRAMNLAKFSLDEDDDIVLSVDYRLADLDPSEVRDAVNVVSFYTDKYYEEVARLAAPDR